MSQSAFKLRKIFGQPCYKIIFGLTDRDGKFQKVCERYVKLSQTEVKVNKDHVYPIVLEDWSQQAGNVKVQYRHYDDAYKIFSLNPVKEWKRNEVENVSAKQFAKDKVAQIAQGVLSGAQLNAGIVLLIITLVAGIMGGALLGYFGFPALTGQHLVSNPVVK
jgi:hypothetical protein